MPPPHTHPFLAQLFFFTTRNAFPSGVNIAIRFVVHPIAFEIMHFLLFYVSACLYAYTCTY